MPGHDPQKFNPENVMMHKDFGEVPRDTVKDILQQTIEESRVMQLGQAVEMKDENGNPVTEKTFLMQTDAPGAYWVGEGRKIQTSKPGWTTAKMSTHKLGVILPVSREYLYYNEPQFFERMKPQIVRAFRKKLDEAALLNVDNPLPVSVILSARKQKIEGEINYDNILALTDILAENDVDANAFITTPKNRSALRGAKLIEGAAVDALYDKANNTIDSLPAVDLKSTEMEKGQLIAGNFDYLYYGIPYTMTYRVSQEAQLSTIENEDGSPVNLFEQEMAALRVTMDVGFHIARDDAFAIIEPAGAEDPESV